MPTEKLEDAFAELGKKPTPYDEIDGGIGPATRPYDYSILCIFTPTGRTYTFKDVNIICDNETVLMFNYSAVSDGKVKVATFPKSTLCGWATTLA